MLRIYARSMPEERAGARPSCSVVVVAYDMARELPRTVRSLLPPYQTGIDTKAYELVVVDNGSPQPLAPLVRRAVTTSDADVALQLIRIDPAPPSPARAANEGVAAASGDVIGLVVDGARLASPGLVASAVVATRLAPRVIVTSPAYHLGDQRHMDAATSGHDQDAEDALLEQAQWETDGDRLFAISTLAGSSGRGWFGPMGESSALFMSRELWDEVGGLDEAFTMPGGGLVNHDLYRRACALDDVRLVVLLGQGTFHQFHGGAATTRRYTWDEMHAQYESIRDEPYVPPANAPWYFGGIPETAIVHLERSTEWLVNRQRAAGS
jgi:glycosyltransferase involved in cell wall biosynthesis